MLQQSKVSLSPISKARAKLDILSAIKSHKSINEIEYLKMMKYNRKASFYNLNNNEQSKSKL